MKISVGGSLQIKLAAESRFRISLKHKREKSDFPGTGPEQYGAGLPVITKNCQNNRGS